MKPLSNLDIYGNWATLLLASDDHGKPDYARLEDEIDVLIASAPCGIYTNGTAGEFYAQDMPEFEKTSRLVAEKCEKAGVPFQIGVSHPCAQESRERLRVVRELRPGAVQLILPDWFPPGEQEIFNFFEVMQSEAQGIPLVLYNPPHAKRVLVPEQWMKIKKRCESLVGVKTFDNNGDKQWFAVVREHVEGLSVFIPGHRLASGISQGAHGAYSNVACLNPFAAQKWYELMINDMDAALEIESRIKFFMDTYIAPLITVHGYANHACDRFMARVGGWCDVGMHMRWPYRSVPEELEKEVRQAGQRIIPEFIKQT